MKDRYTSVWYRSTPLTRRWPFGGIRAYEDVGTLTVEPGRVSFDGRKVKVVLEHPVVKGVGHQGADKFNRWVEVVSAGGEHAFLIDGSRLGWRGALGGNERLATAIHEAQST